MFNREQAEKVWDEIFPMKKGQKVILLKTTMFGTKKRAKFPMTVKAGTRGVVVMHIIGDPFVEVNFGFRDWTHFIEVERVKRLW